MKVLVSGGTGLVGRYIVEGLLRAGYEVIIGGRHAPATNLFSRSVGYVPLTLDPQIDQIEAFDDAYLFVHAAFDHLPGKYRGGEGDDPETFRRRNLDGSVALFEAARRAGTRRCVFLSSRAVYGRHAPDTLLREEMTAEHPETLYGEIKLCAERSLAALSGPGFTTASLRLTGVYGNQIPNKWQALFDDYLCGKPVAARAGTEVHGRDVAQAVRVMLSTEAGQIDGQVFNVSDMLTDTREILSMLQEVSGCRHGLPAAADSATVHPMASDRISALGWAPGGKALLRQTVGDLYRQMQVSQKTVVGF